MLWAIAGESAGFGWPYRIALICVCFQLFWQAQQVDTASQPDCSRKFRSNRWTGWILLIGIIAAHVL